MHLPFPSGSQRQRPGPLDRYLPPLEIGMVQQVLRTAGSAEDILLDPLGASPGMVLEAASTGRGVWVAVTNPITRFILKYSLSPFRLEELQSGLAELAGLQKDGSRLENFLLQLYETQCSKCGETIIADYFVWDRDEDTLIGRAYACHHCNHLAEEPPASEDIARAQTFRARGLQDSMALEQIAPAGDPDRQRAEEALAVYPGRARFAMVTLVNKLPQLTLTGRQEAAVHALLLAAFDAVNGLWSHPEGRKRPKRLIASNRFREVNIWRALEGAVNLWAMEDPGFKWVESTEFRAPNPGEIVIYPGPAREIVSSLSPGSIQGGLMVIPRPNQAFWTLSALWSSWLWGKAVAEPMIGTIRRRRYDWNWHADALRRSLGAVSPDLSAGTPVIGLIPEIEPGFLEAVLAGLDGAGFELTGQTHRFDTLESVLTWRVSGDNSQSSKKGRSQSEIAAQLASDLEEIGEPATFARLHAAGWIELNNQGALGSVWEQSGAQPLTEPGKIFDAMLAQDAFERLDEHREIESGLFWLKADSNVGASISDRTEQAVVELLRGPEEFTLSQHENRVHKSLSGWLTPDRRLVQACLDSYAIEDRASGLWGLREEDNQAARLKDQADVLELLHQIAKNLGYQIKEEDGIFLEIPQKESYQIIIQETAQTEQILARPSDEKLILMIPGGRASLIAYKAGRDPRLKAWLDNEGRIAKYRHIRRLAAEKDLQPEEFVEKLAIDPPEHHDPQMPLL